MSNKHVAKQGVKAGQWTTCNAKIRCRNGGVHVDSRTLKAMSQHIYDVTGRL